MNEPTHSLQDFLNETAERDRPGDVFELESPKMLEAHVNGRMWSKLGTMIAYRGNLTFQREGMLEKGLGRLRADATVRGIAARAPLSHYQ